MVCVYQINKKTLDEPSLECIRWLLAFIEFSKNYCDESIGAKHKQFNRKKQSIICKLQCFQTPQLDDSSIPLFVVRFYRQSINSGGKWLTFLHLGNLLVASSGAYAGWAAVNFVNLQKIGTTFPSGPLTLTQATRVMSVFFASAIVGNLLIPHIVKRFGSKRTMFALGFPQLVGIKFL